MKHRKLFPTSDSNQAVTCADCEPTCRYGCFPEVYFPPPLPPPISTNQTNDISPYVIIIVTLFGSVFLLLAYNAIVVKYCSSFRGSTIQSNGPDEEFFDENRGPEVDHPIWYITTVGLQSSVINSITVIKFKKGDSLVEGTDCSVCLNEFRDDETLRLLPKCNHAFHVPCIDTWLRSHTNCPLCRASILSNNSSVSVANDQNSQGFSSNPSTQMGNQENDTELDVIQVREGEISETREETEDEGKGIDDSKIELVRRSFSMDSAAQIIFTEMDFRSVEWEGSSVNSAVNEKNYDDAKRNIRTSIAQSLHKGPVSMKRSFSYGGRSFLSRHCRSANCILPQ